MTEEQMSPLLDIELMEKGILKPQPPQLKTIKSIELQSKIYYEIGGLIFDNMEDAQKVANLNPLQSDYDYNGAGYNYKYPKNVSKDISNIKLYDRQEVVNLQSILKQNKEAEEYNSKATDEYNNAIKNSREATEGIWKDWQGCKNKAHAYQTIINTREEYLRMTGGNPTVTKNFLLKAFDKNELEKL